MISYNEALTKSWHSAQFLTESLQQAHALARREAEEMVLSDLLDQASLLKKRLTRLAMEEDGSEE